MTASAPLPVHAPWDLSAVRKVNGRHPLLMPLLDDQPGLSISMESEPPDVNAASKAAVQLLRSISPLGGFGRSAAQKFIDDRDLPSQAQMMGRPEKDALLFLHTTPFTLGQRPWILHIEEMLTLFEPDIGHGRSMDVAIRDTPIWTYVRALLEDQNCKAVFTHLDHSAQSLGRLFDSNVIADKTHFAPLGHHLPPSLAQKADASWDLKEDRKGAGHFLFTGSWNNHGGSFVQRGGIEIALAFAELVHDYPEAKLTMRTSLPPSIREPFGDLLRKTPNITWIEDPVDDAQLIDLFVDADVFLLPSAGLHSISLLRAMATGAVVLSADAPGVEQFLVPGETGEMVKLFQPNWSRWDPETGLLRQSYKVYEEGHNQAFVPILRDAMADLLDNPQKRQTLRQAARAHVLEHHDVAPWRAGFMNVVQKAFQA